MSGSLWFDGLADFLQHAPPTLPERAYFSVGDREKNSKNPRLACVETRTQAAHQLMQARRACLIAGGGGRAGLGNAFQPLACAQSL